MPVWRQWRLVHGHLLGMGGFNLVDPDLRTANPEDQNGQLLTVDRFKELIERPDFDHLPDIPEEGDIEDRSKGDVLFKLIAILQTSWFIIQCIARGQQRLALTDSELELVTLALASLNAVTFAIWWHKPLGVQKPIKIYLKIEARILEDAAQRDRSVDLSFGDVIRRCWKHVKGDAAGILNFLRNPCEYGPIAALILLFIILPITLTYTISFPFFVVFPLGVVLLLKIIETEPVPSETSQSRGLLAARIVVSLKSLRYRLSSAVGKFVGRWLEKIFHGTDFVHFIFGWYILLPVLFFLLFLFVIFLIPFVTLLLLVSFIFTAVFGIVTTSTIRPGASHVPSFYALATNSDRWSRMVVFALFGVIFGGLHCIGWSFEYPTHLEQTLWRATSLAITIIPLIVAPIDLLLAARLRIHDIKSCKTFERTALLALDLIMTILLFIYVPARLCLIALALALLRNLPLTALVAVDWTKYVPHLFS